MSSVLTTYRTRQYDPTRTVTLRNAFAAQMNKRFIRLRGLIRQVIYKDDVFGLMGTYARPGRKAFAFSRSGDKVQAFMNWLNDAQTEEILGGVSEIGRAGGAIDAAWTNKYIRTGYERGIDRARQEMKKHGIAREFGDSVGAAMNSPFHADRLGVLYTRAFQELKGITEQMDVHISRILTEGIGAGDNPLTLARKLNATIAGGGQTLGITDSLGRYIPAQRRARMLARTEIIRAHHMATVQEYRNMGLHDVKVVAEWTSAGDDGRTCEYCLSLDGETYTLKEVERLIPAHPHCRCITVPVPEDVAKAQGGLRTAVPADQRDVPKALRPGGEYLGNAEQLDPSIFKMLHKGNKVNLRIEHGGEQAYFSPWNNRVNLVVNDRTAKSAWHKRSVVYHEYGHAIDYQNGFRSSQAVKKLMEKWRKRFEKPTKIRRPYGKMNEVTGRYEHLGYRTYDVTGYDAFDMRFRGLATKIYRMDEGTLKRMGLNKHDALEQISSLADTVMSLNSKYGWGHTKTYMAKTSNQIAEFIANAFENRFAGNFAFRKLAPELYEDMVKLVKSWQ